MRIHIGDVVRHLKERQLQQNSWSLMKIYICTEF